MTDTELSVIAALAQIGLISTPIEPPIDPCLDPPSKGLEQPGYGEAERPIGRCQRSSSRQTRASRFVHAYR